MNTLTAVIGLAAPLARSNFTAKTRVLQAEAENLLETNVTQAGKRARQAVDPEESSDMTIDVPTTLDGAWQTRLEITKRGGDCDS